MSRFAILTALVAAVALSVPAGATAAPSWRLEQPAVAGAPWAVPLGAPGDLKLLSGSRGLLTVEGNAAVGKGVWTWNGRAWRPLTTVCGGAGATARIAVAGPRDVWVVADPAAELRVTERGTTLCHLRDGAIVASYAVPPSFADPYASMNAATCSAPDACWFAGESANPGGGRRGAFHLRWDGGALTTSYNPQGRAVSDVQALGADVWESSFVGARADVLAAPTLAQPEPTPKLLRRITTSSFEDQTASLPSGMEPLALDADGAQLWAVGGGASSGDAPDLATGYLPLGPFAQRLAGGAWSPVALPSGAFGLDDRFVDVAAVPGTDTAWVAVEPFEDRRDTQADTHVALVRADGTVLENVVLPGAGGIPRGTAAKIACSGPTDCWLATTAGWLYHYTDGTQGDEDGDPAYATTLTVRPSDARTPQSILDAPPEDDSLRNAPPPTPEQPSATPPPAKALPALIKGRVRSTWLNRRTLRLRFTTVRRARIGIVARRGRAVVGRVATRTLRPGRHRLVLRLRGKRPPTSVKFITRELTKGLDQGSGGGDTTTTTTTTTTTAAAAGARRVPR